MKVLYDHQIFIAQKFGGISRYFKELLDGSQNDLESIVIDPALFEHLNKKPSNSYFSRGARAAKRKLGLQNALAKKQLPKQVVDLFAKKDFDIFHPTYYDPYFLEYLQKPFILTVYDMIHEIYSEYFYDYDTTTHTKKILCDQASHIIAISEKTKYDLVQIFGVPEEKITTVLLASSFNPKLLNKPNGVDGIDKFILFTGSRALYKNFYFPIAALSEILKADKDLNILCSGHPFTPRELSYFKDFGIEKQIHHVFLKDDAELAWAYSNAELFIFPSLYEGFGFPVLEAFACSCPLISSTGGSLPEVAGDAAIYFDPKSYKEIQQAATDVLYNKETKSTLIEKGLRQFDKFSWDKCRNETYEVYKKVLE